MLTRQARRHPMTVQQGQRATKLLRRNDVSNSTGSTRLVTDGGRGLPGRVMDIVMAVRG
jgi:hypothetical protein